MNLRTFARPRALVVAAGCLAALAAGTTAAVADAPRTTSAPPGSPSGPDARFGIVTTTAVTDSYNNDGRFDIKSVRHTVSEAGRHHVWVSYTVRTYPSWVDLRLDRRYRNFVLELNRDGERGSEVNVRVAKVDGHIVAELISNATRHVLRRVQVSRYDDHSFTISGPRQWLGAHSYFWTSNFHSPAPRTLCGMRSGHPVTCQDSVPQDGWIRMNQSAWPHLSG